MKYKFYDDDVAADDDGGTEVPGKFEVCPRCRGRGVHDGWDGGMTGDEMAEQGPEFFDDYQSGVYDKRCTVCNGLRVVEVVDTDRLPPGLRMPYQRAERSRLEMEAEIAAERRFGY
ncbi:hypothetical protein [Mycolicibacterium sphagni]|uniref:hypothetical protein n=1 Tax=Mycolicibacterium sphagni TaxID=1786 RepID=UPI0021F3C7A1|nr:hypothetical protein [Mycolicibacterium sphagni]MCV7174840.1 hypothetical protein [Mycolicibacterium sphagni]